MRVLKLNKGKLEGVDNKPFKLEKEIQSLVENNTEELFGLEFIASELTVGKYRLDSLCYYEENETLSFVIIEYKRGNSYSVIDQGYTYLQLLLNNKSAFVLALSQHLGKVLKVENIDWSQSKIIFISQSFNSFQKDSVNFKNLPFELYEVKRFQNDMLILNKHETTSNESINSLSTGKINSAIDDVNKEIVSYDEEYHLNRVSEKIAKTWLRIKERLNEFEDIEMNSKKHYISITLNSTSLAFFHFRKNSIAIDINRGNINTDGVKSKNYFDIDDPKGITEERSWKWKSGAIGNVYVIKFSSDDDIDYLMFLLNQKYKNLNL